MKEIRLADGSVKVAIIGCGRISEHHCKAIIAVDGIELVAICDLELEKATTLQEKFGVKAYDDYHAMFDDNLEVSTVVIATPSGMHFEHAMEMITLYRKHIIIEKPTFMNPSQVRVVYAEAAARGLQVFAVFQNRHNKAVARVLEGLAGNELGRIRTMSVRVRWCRPQRYYDLAPWRGTFSMDGGCLTNQGIHHIDLMRKIGGEVKRVLSIHRTLGANIEVEDTVAAIIEFESGAMGTLEITTAARPVDFEASLSVVCEKGLAQLGGIAVNELQIYSPESEACAECSEDFSGNVYGNGHSKMYEEISNHFRYDIDYPISMEDTLGTIKLLNAFYLSNESQDWSVVEDIGDSQRLGEIDNTLADLYRSRR